MSRASLSSLLLAGLALAALPAAAAAQAGGAVPTFNDRTIEITDRHVGAMLAGLRMQNDTLAARLAAWRAAKRAYDDSVRAYPALQAKYEQERAALEACHERNVRPELESAEREMQAAQAEAGGPEAMQAAMEKVAERVKAAQQRGDMAEVMRLADSVQKASAAMNAGMIAGAQRAQTAAEGCGTEPVEPRHPTEPFYDRSVPPVPLDRTLWSDPEQYAVMYDRLLPLLGIENDADFDRALRTAFSPAEQQAIGSQAGALRTELRRQNELLSQG